MKARRLLLAIALLPACKGNAKSTEPTTDVPGARAKASVEEPAAVAQAEAPPLPKEKVQAAVQAWIDAQNQGDFAAYSASYAKRFTGIKRVGSKKRGYDRARWLVDRGRMFKKKMKVVAADMEVRANASSASVRFTQTWSSGKFKDVGPKQLIVVLEEGKLLIAREEMLSSAVLSSQRTPSGTLEGLLFTAPEIDGFIVQAAEEGWATGEPALTGSEPYISTRAVAMDALPAALRSLKGLRATVYGLEGACVDTVAKLSVVAGVTPHFGYFQDDEGEQREVGDKEMARDIFNMGTPYLVAVLAGKCTGGIMQLAGKKREVMNLALVKDEVMSAKVNKAFDEIPDYKALQAQYEKEANEDEKAANPTGNWAEQGELSLFHDAQGNRHLAVVNSSGGVGCGGFYGSLTAVFQIGVDGKVQLLGTTDTSFEATRAFDLDGDGRIEFEGTANDMVTLDAGILGISEEGTYDLLHRFGWEYQDCPC